MEWVASPNKRDGWPAPHPHCRVCGVQVWLCVSLLSLQVPERVVLVAPRPIPRCGLPETRSCVLARLRPLSDFVLSGLVSLYWEGGGGVDELRFVVSLASYTTTLSLFLPPPLLLLLPVPLCCTLYSSAGSSFALQSQYQRTTAVYKSSSVPPPRFVLLSTLSLPRRLESPRATSKPYATRSETTTEGETADKQSVACGCRPLKRKSRNETSG